MVLPPWWILNGVKPDGPEVEKGTAKFSSFSEAQQAQFGVDSEGKVTDQEKYDAAIAAIKEKKAAVAPKAAAAPAGATEMKVTAKRSAGFYAGSACSFLRGVDAKPADGDKEATDAKPAVDYLRISGLGEAINTAVAAASKVEAEGLGSIVKVQTCYPEMEGSGRGVAQILIDVKKK